jgi:hypothetical protein
MTHVAISNKLVIDRDVRNLGIGNSEFFGDYFLAHPNQTYYGVIFCTTA